MCENLKKSQKLVSIVAESILLDFVNQAKRSGLTQAQIKNEVNRYIQSPEFILALQRKIDEILEKMNEPEAEPRLN